MGKQNGYAELRYRVCDINYSERILSFPVS